MKFVVVIIVFIISLPSWANKIGIGLSIGNPTGFNGKYWVDEKVAIDGGLAFSLGRHTELSIHSDYLLHNKSAFYLNNVHPLDLYYGLGGRMEFSDDIEIGVRVPVGLVYLVEAHNADIFSEIAPIVDFISRTGLEIHLLFGGRYYF
jgi:hypothetical protein